MTQPTLESLDTVLRRYHVVSTFVHNQTEDNWRRMVAAILAESRVEIIHHRDPDMSCRLILFIDGVEIDGGYDVYEVDAGAGHLRTEWDQATDEQCAGASPGVAARLRPLRTSVADYSDQVDDDRSSHDAAT